MKRLGKPSLFFIGLTQSGKQMRMAKGATLSQHNAKRKRLLNELEKQRAMLDLTHTSIINDKKLAKQIL